MSEVQRRTVLVVDDEPQVLAAIEDTLEDDYRVLAHTSPKSAIRVVEQEAELSVILSDQRMPQMNGDEFLTRARAVSDAARLMITGYADLEAVIRAVNDGQIFGYISKPWDPAALKLAVFKAAEHHRLLRELSQEKRLFANLMDNIPDPIFFKDREHRFTRLNRAHAVRLGLARPEDALGRATREFFTAEEARARDAEDDEVFRTGAPLVDRQRNIRMPGGESRWILTSKAPIRDDKGEVSGLVAVSRDITLLKQAEDGVRRLNRVYAVLSGINSLIVRVRELDELYQGACRIATEAGGFRMAWIGTYDAASRAIKPVAFQGVEDGFLRLARLDFDSASPESNFVRRAVEERRPMIVNDVERAQFASRDEALARGYRSGALLPLVTGTQVRGVLGLASAESGFFDAAEMRLLNELAGDIAFAVEHIEKSKRLNYLAYYDSLTGLANRSLFFEHVGQACREARESGERLAVVLMDLDRFKNVNDTLGRQAGDALLQQVAERTRRHSAEKSRLARLGADRFGIMVTAVASDDELARRIEEHMLPIFSEAFHVDGTELRISAKLGVALFPQDGTDAETLFRNAEAALKRAKRSGETYLFYSEDMTSRVAEHLRLESRLRRALERDEFVLHYQPKVELASRRIVGLEALIRWRADGELVPPGRFIPLMEETGLILEAGTWALRQAVRDRRALLERGLAAPRIAVNVSAIQLRKRDFADVVQAVVSADASPALDLEITESLVMEAIEHNIPKLAALRDLGVRIAIDDFGTGYSSLAYLAKLPVHSLKIDRSFIVRMLEDANTMTLVSTIISLGHSLKLEVVAEGVETEEQAKMLGLLRCDQMQGYVFSKPLPLDGLAALLSSGSSGSPRAAR